MSAKRNAKVDNYLQRFAEVIEPALGLSKGDSLPTKNPRNKEDTVEFCDYAVIVDRRELSSDKENDFDFTLPGPAIADSEAILECYSKGYPNNALVEINDKQAVALTLGDFLSYEDTYRRRNENRKRTRGIDNTNGHVSSVIVKGGVLKPGLNRIRIEPYYRQKKLANIWVFSLILWYKVKLVFKDVSGEEKPTKKKKLKRKS